MEMKDWKIVTIVGLVAIAFSTLFVILLDRKMDRQRDALNGCIITHQEIDPDDGFGDSVQFLSVCECEGRKKTTYDKSIWEGYSIGDTIKP